MNAPKIVHFDAVKVLRGAVPRYCTRGGFFGAAREVIRDPSFEVNFEEKLQ
jgi:hypothetical protein